MANDQEFLAALRPLTELVATLDLRDPAAAKARLDEAFPLSDHALNDIRARFREGLNEGWLCHREQGGVRFSRVLKAADADAVSIDAVHMRAPGPGHLHPSGEVDLCFAVDGAPTFDGNPEGWTVYPPGSWHVPTVTGGSMDILYFLPGGAITFGPKPDES